MAKKILLVDDEEDFQELMGIRIKGWGYDFIQALNGRGAIEALKSKNPDIIILDYVMPDMNGVEVLKKIRKIDRKIPVIMFTAHPDEKSFKGARKLGITAYVPKLSEYSDILVALREAIYIAEKQL